MMKKWVMFYMKLKWHKGVESIVHDHKTMNYSLPQFTDSIAYLKQAYREPGLLKHLQTTKYPAPFF